MSKIYYKPHRKGILIEYQEIEKTSSGIHLPEGTDIQTLEQYDGEVVVAVGEEVTFCKPGDTVLFFPNSIPTSFEGKTDTDKRAKYQLFREGDIAALVLPKEVIEPPTTL